MSRHFKQCIVNAFQQGQKCNTFCKNVKIVEFHDYIWNHHKKCIQISTNMPSIGFVIPEITCEMLEFGGKKPTILLSKTNGSRGKC